MRKSSRVLIAIGALVLIAESALLIFVGWRGRHHAAAASTPVVRGREIAERMSCFSCHGPDGLRGVANPGSRGNEVPGWTSGTAMMWNRDEADVRSWIRDGRPLSRTPDRDAPIDMPAFGSRLSARELDDVVAYVLAVSTFGEIDDAAASRGRDVAVRMGCFGCHGPEGRGLLPNPGSLTGYIPAWDGSDFDDLVRGPDEFREWVLDGAPERLRSNPIAREAFQRQVVKMPAYRGSIDDSEVSALRAYVDWIRAHPRTGQEK